jgi:microcystin-dependent protein
MCDYAGPNLPNGWLPCDGRQLSRVDYAALFAAIGNYWGAGDGSTTFNLPDLRGYATVGVGNGIDTAGGPRPWTLAQKFGYWFVGLTQGNLPDYKLPMTTAGEHQHTANTDANGDHSHTGGTDANGDHSHSFTAIQQTTTGLTGGTGAGGINNRTDTTSVAGAHSHNLSTTVNGAHSHHLVTLAGQGGHGHDVWLSGGGQAHENVQPSAGVLKLIFTGRVTLAATRTDPVPGTLIPDATGDALGHPS